MSGFDYIEIGTADFDTICDLQAGKGLRGLSVEPLGFYLDRLKNDPGNQKVNAAIGRKPRYDMAYFIRPDVIRQNSLPEWVRGCSCIGRVHPLAAAFLSDRQISDAFDSATVEVISFRQLCDRYQVTGLGMLKIDAEGMDCEILESWLEAATDDPGLFAPVVMAECHGTDRNGGNSWARLRDRMKSLRYEFWYSGEDIIFRRR